MLGVGDIEAQMGRGLAVGAEHRAGRQHDAVLDAVVREGARVAQAGNPGPHELPAGGRLVDHHSDPLEKLQRAVGSPREASVEPLDIFAVVAFGQHQVDHPLGEFGARKCGHDLHVGEGLGEVVAACQIAHPQVAEMVFE